MYAVRARRTFVALSFNTRFRVVGETSPVDSTA
jgi:hypothetical protein